MTLLAWGWIAPATTLQTNNPVLCFTADRTAAFSRMASLGHLRLQRIPVDLFRSWLRYGNFLDRSDGTLLRRRFAIKQIASDTTISERASRSRFFAAKNAGCIHHKFPPPFCVGCAASQTGSLPRKLLLVCLDLPSFCFVLKYTGPRHRRDVQRFGAFHNLRRYDMEIL